MSALKVLAALSVVATAACEYSSPLEGQTSREVVSPYFVVTDNLGCRWRLELSQSGLVDSYKQIREDGSADCGAPAKATGVAS